jgi:serine protease Do
MKLSVLMDSALDELLVRVRPLLAVVRDGHRGAGAGLLVGDGLVLTNAHVVRGRHPVEVTLADDKEYPARLVASDPRVDLALLEIPADGNGEAVFSEETPRTGELVFAFGHPWGQRNVLTGGVLSAVTVARSCDGDIPILRADVQLAPGNSGGPLLNAAGQVLGLNAMIFGGDQSVAIPASLIRPFLEAARKERVPEGVL